VQLVDDDYFKSLTRLRQASICKSRCASTPNILVARRSGYDGSRFARMLVSAPPLYDMGERRVQASRKQRSLGFHRCAPSPDPKAL